MPMKSLLVTYHLTDIVDQESNKFKNVKFVH